MVELGSILAKKSNENLLNFIFYLQKFCDGPLQNLIKYISLELQRPSCQVDPKYFIVPYFKHFKYIFLCFKYFE